MARKVTKATRAAYIRRRLADPNTHPADRKALEMQALAFGCRCVKCGRKIEHPDSLRQWSEDGFGPECRSRQAVAS